jgi:hypothetical protein
VVHVSEWRGSGYLCLLAKRQNLAFLNTLFVVKTSSPWLWNRLYGSQPIDSTDDLMKVHAERLSVEYADVVVAGSLHLLRWMLSQGYKIPRTSTFVQPNVATFDHLSDLLKRRKRQAGQRYPIDEIVFFGRLEARKGLLLFIQAIKRLLREGKELPQRITFMGKPGTRLVARPDQDIVDYIRAETQKWPTTVEIMSEFQQYEALKYLLSGSRLAVMPSLIENSSLAVYEAAICGIPFIASASGGTPELIAPTDRASVLCEAHPIPLANHIAVALCQGGYVASPSFDNDANLDQWRRFHLDLGRGLLQRLLKPRDQDPTAASRVSVCVYHADTEEKLRATLVSIKDQDLAAEEILIAVDTEESSGLERAESVAADLGVTAKVIPAFDLDAGYSFNTLAYRACGDFVLFVWAGSVIRSMAIRALTRVAASTKADIVNYFFRVSHGDEAPMRDHLSAIVFGNVAQNFFRTDVTALPLLVRREVFVKLGGFTPDYRVLAHDYEFVAKAQVNGIHCETALLELGSVPAWDEQWLRSKCYNQEIAQFRAIRPELATAPLIWRELLLTAKGLQTSGGRRVGAAAGPAAQKMIDGKVRPVWPALTALLIGLFRGERIMAPSGPSNIRGANHRTDRHRPAFVEAAPPALAVGSIAPSIAPRAVARDVRKDKRNAQEASVRGAGLVQLIDELGSPASAMAVVPVPRPATTPSGRASVRRRAPDTREEARPADSCKTSNTTRKRYVSRFLGVYQGVAYGWVRDDEQPDRTVEIELIDGQGPRQVVRADIDLPTVLPVASKVRNHGFAVSLWRGSQRLRRYPSIKQWAIQIKGTDLLVGRIAAARNVNDLEETGFDGYCDISAGKMVGWVWQPARPESSVDVSVFVDGKFLVRTSAAQYREDLRAANVGSGAYGFTVPLPFRLLDGTARRVDVVVADTGAFLKRGRLRLIGSKLEPIRKWGIF